MPFELICEHTTKFLLLHTGIIYSNEFRDDQRLVTWLKGVDMKEKEDIKSNYAVSWR